MYSANSSMFVVAVTSAPASASRRTTVALSWPVNLAAADPQVAGTPATATLSFTPTASDDSGPSLAGKSNRYNSAFDSSAGVTFEAVSVGAGASSVGGSSAAVATSSAIASSESGTPSRSADSRTCSCDIESCCIRVVDV